LRLDYAPLFQSLAPKGLGGPPASRVRVSDDPPGATIGHFDAMIQHVNRLQATATHFSMHGDFAPSMRPQWKLSTSATTKSPLSWVADVWKYPTMKTRINEASEPCRCPLLGLKHARQSERLDQRQMVCNSEVLGN
jgi:hypothetical protein